RLPIRNERPPPVTQCLAVRIQVGAMMVAEQVSLPLENSRAAHGPLLAYPPPMMGCTALVMGGAGASAAAAVGESSARTVTAAAVRAGKSRDMRKVPRFLGHAAGACGCGGERPDGPRRPELVPVTGEFAAGSPQDSGGSWNGG